MAIKLYNGVTFKGKSVMNGGTAPPSPSPLGTAIMTYTGGDSFVASGWAKSNSNVAYTTETYSGKLARKGTSSTHFDTSFTYTIPTDVTTDYLLTVYAAIVRGNDLDLSLSLGTYRSSFDIRPTIVRTTKAPAMTPTSLDSENWHKFQIRRNSAASTREYWIDGELVHSRATSALESSSKNVVITFDGAGSAPLGIEAYIGDVSLYPSSELI